MTVSHVTSPDASPRASERAHGRASSRPPLPTDRAPVEKKGPGAAILLLVVPVLCCGGPLIVAALAAASAATIGVVGGVVGAFLVAVGLGLFVRNRRRAACCAPAPAQKAWRP